MPLSAGRRGYWLKIFTWLLLSTDLLPSLCFLLCPAPSLRENKRWLADAYHPRPGALYLCHRRVTSIPPSPPLMAPSRMVTSSRRAGRVTNKTKLLIYRGSNKVDLAHAEIIVWDQAGENGTGGKAEANKHQHVGAIGVESGELLVSRVCSFIFSYA